MNRTMMDSGPLIALFSKDDTYSNAALDFLRMNRAPLVTTMPVITEVMYLLDFSIHAQSDFMEWVIRGGLTVIDLGLDDFRKIKDLMKKYADLPMDFTDGSLVAACEKTGSTHIATIDKDFEIYRYHNNRKFNNVFKKFTGK